MVSGAETGLPSYRRLVERLILPVGVGGHPALDFCNTYAGRGEPKGVEYLLSYEHLGVFAREAGLIDGRDWSRARAASRARPSEAEGVLESAKELREALYRLCVSGHDRRAWGVVAAHVEAAAGAAAFVPHAGGPAARWTLSSETGLALPLLAIAGSVGELLLSVDLAEVGRCPGNVCGWLFIDPRHRRRWCSMATCGNRAKARRHAAKGRAATARSASSGRSRRA